MPKFRYSTDRGETWTYRDGALPFTIPSLAAQDVIVEPIGADVINAGSASGPFLTLVYDPSQPGQDMAATTNTAGTFRYAVTTSMTPPSAAAITAGTGFYAAGSVATVAGTLAIVLPPVSGSDDLFFHAFVDGTTDTPIATKRVYIGTNSAFATIGSTTGNPTVTNYTDGDGTWRAYEFTGNGSFTVTAGGGVEYELVAGGGGGGGGVLYCLAGGGGAGGYLNGTTTLSSGTFPVVVGAGGAGGKSSGRSTSGANSTALDLTAIGGGAGGAGDTGQHLALTGGSGGGAHGGASTGPAGTSGQGYKGGNGTGAIGGGGGGAGAAGGNGVDGGLAGAGGAGVSSSITGTVALIAGGGGGSGANGPGSASHGGGAGTDGPSTFNATKAGAGGGAGAHETAGGNGYRGRFVIRVKVA